MKIEKALLIILLSLLSLNSIAQEKFKIEEIKIVENNKVKKEYNAPASTPIIIFQKDKINIYNTWYYKIENTYKSGFDKYGNLWTENLYLSFDNNLESYHNPIVYTILDNGIAVFDILIDYENFMSFTCTKIYE